jgi:hypothetical protein
MNFGKPGDHAPTGVDQSKSTAPGELPTAPKRGPGSLTRSRTGAADHP